MRQKEEFRISPIGRVRNDFNYEIPLSYGSEISEIVIDDEYAEGLEDLEEFSHAIIIYWMDRSKWKSSAIKGHPVAQKDFPAIGVFASRSPIRPNLIGLATVKVLKRDRNTLIVEGLDAYNNTPVLDIKPYMLGYDNVKEAKFPAWVYRAWELIEEGKRKGEVQSWQKAPSKGGWENWPALNGNGVR